MSHLTGRRILLLGFIVVLLIAIPITVFLVKQQQQTQSSAVAATTLSFFPTTPSAGVGEIANLDIFVDPSSSNAVNFIKVVLTYDSTKVATVEAGLRVNSWTLSSGTTFTPVLEAGPTYAPNSVSFSINTGASPQNLIQSRTKIATVSFKAIAPTEEGIPTQIIFANQSQVLSAGDSVVNVLSSSAPALLTISLASATGTPTLTPTRTPTPTIAPATTGTLTPTITPTPDTGGDLGELDSNLNLGDDTGLLCSSLNVDPSTQGVAPFSVNFTATGSSSASAIIKVSFDFGDGASKDVTDSGGIGTDAISVLTSHTYQSAGTFTATATLTDEVGNETAEGCSADITVSSSSTPTPTLIMPSPLPPTGGNGFITIGAIGAMLFFIGAILLFAL